MTPRVVSPVPGLVAALALGAACASEPPSLAAQGEVALAEDRLADAEAAFRAALAERPSDQRALHGMARVARERGEPERALGWLERLEREDPGYARVVAGADHAWALEASATAWLGADPPEPDAALARVARLDELYPDARRDPLLRARALAVAAERARARGDLDRAERLYREVLATDPSTPEAPLALGGLLLEQGRTSEAVRVLTEALLHHPDDGRLQRLMVDALGRP
jgi:tetratricopeptide (TPR) repeat protein